MSENCDNPIHAKINSKLYQLCFKMIDKEILNLPILFRIYFRKVNAENYTAMNIKLWWNADAELKLIQET